MSRQNLSVYIVAAIVLLNVAYSAYERKKTRADILSSCLAGIDAGSTVLEHELSGFFEAARASDGKIDLKDLDRTQKSTSLAFKANHNLVETCQKMFQ